MTIVYLIRHAHSVFSADEARPLSAAGNAAARVVAELLATQPIAAVHSSPARRAFETVAPLAARLGLPITVHHELRERELPVVADHGFKAQVRAAWSDPQCAVPGGESNVAAQARALPVLRALCDEHAGREIVVSTHGNLLTLILNSMDQAFAFEFWSQLSQPDIYRVQLDGMTLRHVDRIWVES